MMRSTHGTLKISLLTLALSLSLGSLARDSTPSDTGEGKMEGTLLTSMSLHGTAKYGSPGKPFRHFDYVNPNAPKGGLLRMAGNGTFDTLNPYTNKGTPVADIALLYDTLMTKSHDEPFSMYPLVAKAAQIAPDNSSIIFILNDQARFHDGVAITAADVKHTFEMLIGKGHPFYRSYYADVETVEVLSPEKVRFNFKHTDNPELPFILSELPVLPKHFWEKPENDFSSASLTPPLGSGPYQIESVDNGKSITYRRVKNYWAQGLPVNVGRNNFDAIRYNYYRDANIALQALKAGEYDFRLEHIAKNWATAYDVPAVKDGQLILDTISTRNPAPIQGFAFNLRRSVFQDINTRKALSFAMDFEWLNRNLFYNSYLRSRSYFGNSEME
ncbi:MAG: extracellular solute-binding protein, partial [Endozoicomonas sp.]